MPRQVTGAFADSAKLFDLHKSCCVVTAKTVVTLCIANNERYIQVENHFVNCVVVLQIPFEAAVLQSQKAGFFKYKLNLHVSFIEE